MVCAHCRTMHTRHRHGPNPCCGQPNCCAHIEAFEVMHMGMEHKVKNITSGHAGSMFIDGTARNPKKRMKELGF